MYLNSLAGFSFAVLAACVNGMDALFGRMLWRRKRAPLRKRVDLKNFATASRPLAGKMPSLGIQFDQLRHDRFLGVEAVFGFVEDDALWAV
ncbi:MAG: hypothetical protein ACI8Z5_001424 [Lentimonas sp.]|jgi:hypothetical protein